MKIPVKAAITRRRCWNSWGWENVSTTFRHSFPAVSSSAWRWRAFNGRPEVLFADEPTGNLDRKTGDKIADLLFSLNREHGTTLILVTHDPQLAARCDRRLRLVNGILQEEA